LEMRKLQKVGYSTHCISLPRKWVKEWKLKQGDAVALTDESDGSLRVTPKPIMELGQRTVQYVIDCDLCQEPGMLMRVIIGNYVLGRDSFRIISSGRINSSHMEEIRATTRMLIGLSIIEESSDQVIIQCSVDPTKFNIQSLIRRLSIIATTMLDEAMRTLSTSDLSFAKDAIGRENEVDMISRLAARLLVLAQRDRLMVEKIGLKSQLHILGNAVVSKYLELIADQAECIARRVLEIEKSTIKGSDTDVILNLSKLASDIIQEAIECFFAEDMKKANYVLETRSIIDMEQRNFSSEIPGFLTIVEGLATIFEKGAGIAEIAFDRVLTRETDICRCSN
jgi:phosphate uptake regulator